MSRGRRYSTEPKLNMKKVIAVIVAILVIIMFIIAIKNLIKSESSSSNLVSTTYFLFNQDNKWGVIDQQAKIVIEPIYEEAIVIPDRKKDIFICTYNVNYEENTYQTKVLNAKNKEIFSGYDTVTALENYDENNHLWYEENVLLVQKDKKYGLINFDGKEILSTDFDAITTLKGSKNSLITIKDGKKGLVNCLGQKIIDNQYQDIQALGEDTKSYIIKENNQYGIYDKLECKYEEIKPLNHKDIYCVKENGQYKVINQEGKKILPEKFDAIKTIKDNIIVYQYKKQYSAYDFENNKKLGSFYPELNYTENQLFIAKTNQNYGIIDMNNQIKIKADYRAINFYEDVGIYELEEKNSSENKILNPQLEEIAKGIVNDTNAEKSYIRIWTEAGYVYYNLNGETLDSKTILTQNNLFLSKQNGKYGFVDKEGNVVVDYLYDDATEQNEFGYFSVKKDGLWGSIDKNGEIICQTKYLLDENLLVDFIGEYHLGEDLNLMYYTNKE